MISNFKKALQSNKVVLVLMLVMMLALTACGNNAAEGNKQNQGANNQNQQVEDTNGAANSESVYPMTLTDATNTEVTLTESPKAIVSIVPSETEILFAIGLGGNVVGVDEYSNYPAATADIEKVGDFTTNIEAVMALEPDIVLASSSMNGDAITKLRELGIVVYASNPITYDEVVAHINQLGVLLDAQAQAGEVAAEMNKVKEDIVAKVANAEDRKVYLEFSPGYTVGSGEFLDDLVTLAGGINVANGQPGWFEVDAEAVITENPAVIIYPDFGEEQSSILAGIQARPGWEAIDAVKNNEMVMVTNDPLVRVGPRLTQGLSEIAAAIHPELFQ
ncbi:ABC transporter substrate-binding protein [Paenibacillus endoradicis]|uniref:ABC transporter substrate-binding protein n=1 Tax=Paenibacillus endoradicis TaxID=2972487 RepID=UPI0021593991|nr:ABC transporter substrate-binding protein [Paenibacillus endoradicis]MCR8656370.1 ABC transporter substrate-binding protein [Paenibacillus endoradicis]